MGIFKEKEKKRYSELKQSPNWPFSTKEKGEYRNIMRDFCLPREKSEENLYEGIRENALRYFEGNKIEWHDGVNGKPSNHLCDSQVCCVNFLFPFHDKPDDLAEFLRIIYGDVQKVLKIDALEEKNNGYIAFEWIGRDNYLHELIPKGSRRTRGKYYTSADAMVMYERKSGKKEIVLIEWKYAESCSSTSLKISKKGTDRTKIYWDIYNSKICTIDKDALTNYDDLFYDPFDQFMRQQFLAGKMEENREMGADSVSVLHVLPKHNKDFLKVTSAGLIKIGDSSLDIWKKLVKDPDKFKSIYTEDIFMRFSAARRPSLSKWWDYISRRYSWVKEAK